MESQNKCERHNNMTKPYLSLNYGTCITKNDASFMALITFQTEVSKHVCGLATDTCDNVNNWK